MHSRPLPYARVRASSRDIIYLLEEYSHKHRRKIRINNLIECLNWKIRRRTKVGGTFPDARSVLMLICARIPLRHRQRVVDTSLP